MMKLKLQKCYECNGFVFQEAHCQCHLKRKWMQMLDQFGLAMYLSFVKLLET